MTVYLDLDRTLFRTDEFMGELWQVIAELYREPEYAEEATRLANHYVPQSDGQPLYDLSTHLRALGLNPEMLYPQLVQSRLSEIDWLYDGAVQLIDWLVDNTEVRILTYGAETFQRLKLALCPKLAGIPVTIIQSDKAEWLASQRAAGVLIDDKAVAVPATMQLLHVAHDASAQQVNGDTHDSLTTVFSKLKQIVDK